MCSPCIKFIKMGGNCLERTSKKNFIIDFIYTVIIFLLVYLVCRFLLTYLLPFLFAGIIAYSVQPIANFLNRKIKIKQGTVASVLSVVIYLAVAFVLGFLIYRIVVFGIDFADYLPKMLEKFNFILNKIQKLFDKIPKEFNSAFDSIVKNMIDKMANGISGFISSFATTLAKKTPPFLISSIVALVATFYIAKDYKGLSKFLNSLFGSKTGEKIRKIKIILFESVFKLVKGYLILSAVTYAELLLGLFLLKIKYAPLIALIIALVDVLPVIGTGTVMIPWAVLSVFLGNNRLALGLAVLYVIIVIVRNFLEPKIISTQIGMNPLFTLLAMFVGLKVLGFWGLILFPIILIVVIRYYKDEMQEGLSV